MTEKFPDTVTVSPVGSMDLLSQLEVAKLRDVGRGDLRERLRRCALAVLNTGSQLDDARAVFERYADFRIELLQVERGIRLRLQNAPAQAFVDGELIHGIREHLFAVLRDVVYVSNEIEGRNGLDTPAAMTDAVFQILRNARVLKTRTPPDLVVCWGGHSIGREEYDFSKSVGYHLGLRGLNICTGCGPGAMKGPMKGAAVAHAKQRIRDGRYVGVTEPGIIAAEPPNPLVNELVIMPDIEKRLEAFTRFGHGIIVFPGGAGTTEELFYVLGILLNPANRELPFPLVLAGPGSAAPYFEQVDRFLRGTIGPEATQRYQVILDDAERVARVMRRGLAEVKEYRRDKGDAWFFNWRLRVEADFQQPFLPTHEAMAALDLSREQPPHQLAANLRRAFSGIVAGNVKDEGIRRIEEHGPFELRGDREIMDLMDALLQAFVAQHRMRLPGFEYRPCYRLVA
ncbi:nucleotide 5'-monophosphate nucleosidase PpnN [Wenzhouxiangella sp. XN24]|uniref:nucleotide 5'-monophosphate nucleosidase PpnN n=1 Tax=Wenzhouxiangella sp. XN24 TaxID=2713569 RepID=UPI003211F37E